MYGLIDVSGSIPPDLKCILTPIEFFSGNLVIYGFHPMEKIGSICILNRGGLPLKKGPLRIYGLIDVSGSIPLFRSI